MSPTILVLNGASSAGKTSLSRQLQVVLDEPYMLLQEDSFVYDTYHKRWTGAETGARIFGMTMLAYYRSIRACASAGHNLLVDTGFYSADLVRQCARELHGLPVWMIGVHCAVPELERRETARGDRRAGLARHQFDFIHTHVEYDLEVDTSASTLDECALQIQSILAGSAPPAAMERLYARLCESAP